LAGDELVDQETLALETGIGLVRLGELLAELDRAGRIRRDGQGNLIGSAGLSVIRDRHEVEIDGRRFWTWCAYDIFGIFGALAASGRALSPSPGGPAIEVRFVRGRVEPNDAILFRPDADLGSSCRNIYEEWCPNSNLFPNARLAESWANKRGLRGRILDLDDATDQAAQEWRPLLTPAASEP
jgi:alkylmercury lyase